MRTRVRKRGGRPRLYRSPTRVTILLEGSLVRELSRICKKLGMSRNSFIVASLGSAVTRSGRAIRVAEIREQVMKWT